MIRDLINTEQNNDNIKTEAAISKADNEPYGGI